MAYIEEIKLLTDEELETEILQSISDILKYIRLKTYEDEAEAETEILRQLQAEKDYRKQKRGATK
jgi:hypothetical protein